MPERAIFIATLGSQPQVVTLTLDALLRQVQPIERVIILHTADHLEPIGSALAQVKDVFLTQRYYGSDLIFDPFLLAGPTGPLNDVATTEEIEAAFQSVYALLRRFKQSGYTIHLSIAGGRKTMALFAMAAAQLVFGLDDQVWHLVSTPDLIRSRLFHASAPEDVTLVPVPIARWGRLQTVAGDQVALFVHHVLTPAEREVTLLLLQEGLSNAALAQRLDKSPKTIANQLSSIYEKLGQFFSLPGAADRAVLLVLLGTYSHES